MTQESANARSFDIAGKDFLDEQEAAHYACVSYSQFRAQAERYGLRAFRWMGKKVYRKVDLQRAMELAWNQASEADPVPEPSSRARTGFAVLAAAEKAHRRRRRS